MACNFQLKNLGVLNMHSKLQDVVLWAAQNVPYFGSEDLIVTSAYRPGDSGVHGQVKLRGLDLRCRDRWYGFFVETMVNLHWCYDPQRTDLQCCIYHNISPNVDGWHLHFQAHDNTEPLNGGAKIDPSVFKLMVAR